MSKCLRIVCSATLLAFLAWRTDWHEVGDAFAGMRPGLWLAAVVLYVVTQIVSALRWQILCRPLGFERPLWQFASFYFIGMFFNLVLPTSVGGDVVRAWYLDGRSGRKARAFLSVFVDRLSGLVILLGLAALATALCPTPLPGWIHASVWSTVGGAVVGLALLPRLTRHRLVQAKLKGVGEDAALCLAMALRPKVLLLSVLVQAANVVLLWLVGLSIGAPVPPAYYWVVAPMVSLLTLLPVSINGIGVREWGLRLFLAPLGVAPGTAFSLAFLWFGVLSTASLCGGLVYLFGRFPRPEVQTNHEPLRHYSDQGRARQSSAAA